MRMQAEQTDKLPKKKLDLGECKQVIIERLKGTKQRLDNIQKQQRKSPQVSKYDSPQKKKQARIHLDAFVREYKAEIKYILAQFAVLNSIKADLEEQNYQNFDQKRDVLIKSIRQQFKRFQNMIPADIQQRVQLSRLRGVANTQQSELTGNEYQQKNSKQEQQQQIQYVAMPETALKTSMSCETEKIIQNICSLIKEEQQITKSKLERGKKLGAGQQHQVRWENQANVSRIGEMSVLDKMKLEEEKKKYLPFIKNEQQPEKVQKGYTITVKRAAQNILFILIPILFMALIMASLQKKAFDSALRL